MLLVVVIQLSIISNSLTTNQLPFCNKFMLCSTILNCCTNFHNLTLLKLNLLNLHTFFTQGILWTCHTKQKYFLTCSTVCFFYYLISITNELNRNCTSERTQIKCTSHYKQIKVDVHWHVLCKNDKLILSQFLIYLLCHCDHAVFIVETKWVHLLISQWLWNLIKLHDVCKTHPDYFALQF